MSAQDHLGPQFGSLYHGTDHDVEVGDVIRTTSAGKLVLHIFAALAEFERALIVDRTMAGLAAARERGSKPGRKAVLSEAQVKVVRQMHASGDYTVAQIAEVVGGVSRATVYRALEGAEVAG